MIRAIAAAALLAACSVPVEDATAVRWLDVDAFEADVQPILAARCGNPSCHGRPDRPFAVYSALQWRADPARTHLPEPLTGDELAHNYTAACVFVSEAEHPDDALLLRKPLADAAGTYHGGGAVFDGTADDDYRTVRAWVHGGWP